MTTSRIASLIFLLAIPILASAQADPRPIEEEDKLARPILIVPPKFPTREPTDMFPVEIRISGSVGETGELTSPVFLPVTGKEKFIRAIEEVLPHWRFKPAVGDECQPKRSDGVLSVWFEEKRDGPSVSVSTPVNKNNAKVTEDDGKPHVTPRVYEWRPKVDYPAAAHNAGMEGATELLFLVDLQGNVLQTKVLYSTPHKIFGEAAIQGSRRTKFSAGKPDEINKKTICILVPFLFCVSNGSAIYPNSACAYPKSK